jgi:hypothetical protein
MVNTPWASTGIFIYGIEPDKEKQVTEIYKRIVPEGGSYLDAKIPGNILISDKTAEVLKLKQYNITENIISKLRDEKVPEIILTRLDSLKNNRFRSPKDFREALSSGLNRKQLDRYGNKITEYALDYRVKSKIQITISDETGTPVQGTGNSVCQLP